ncbi:MAG TPA: potassium channel family protein, partial [Streptosporangiaceae bacterium]
FTVTVFSTVGFGDIRPESELARLVVTGQMVADLVIIGLGARIVVGAVRVGQRRRSDGGDGAEPGLR